MQNVAIPGDASGNVWQTAVVAGKTTQHWIVTDFAIDDGRLLPLEEPSRKEAADIYESIRHLPIISPHGHIPLGWFQNDHHFSDATSLFISPDHYITRVLHAHGVPNELLGVGGRPLTPAQSREAFRILARHWIDFAGTPMRYWLEEELRDVFGIEEELSEATADRIYDEVGERLASPEYGTLSLLKRFNISFISTTNDPTEDLSAYDDINADGSVPYVLAPAFRPDAYLEPGKPGWADLVTHLGASAGVDTRTYEGFTEAMRRRRAYFRAHGAVLSDHSHADLGSQRLSQEEAERLYASAVRGGISQGDADRLRRHLFNDQALLAQQDGLVMTVHPAIYRDYDVQAAARLGHDIGADVPARAFFSRDLKPLLNEYGNNPDFHFVAFTVDETTFSRDIAPLAGYFPSFYIGVPWWFLDAPESLRRFYEDVVPYAGFTKLSGMIDDTRALCSIPARHDMGRRIISGALARLVCDHRLSHEEAVRLAHAFADDLPRSIFKLDQERFARPVTPSKKLYDGQASVQDAPASVASGQGR